LLAFSRKQVLQPHLLNLSVLVQRTRKMLGRLIGEKFEILFACPNELPSVLADEGGMEQVLINLALNARDAMPDGGSIEISTREVALNESAATVNPDAHPGRFVCLSVTDHGCGMNPQILIRIFDPFFTTKDVGKGTGLGLSTIHGIIKQHEGWVEVDSEVGRGSIFKIFIPVCTAGPAPPQKAGGEKHPEKPGNGETILVVEDEPTVRELACTSLQDCGYQVLQAANGPQAMEIWESNAARISLLLTDMVMPAGMSGGELARVLQSRNPRLKVIFTSGYSPETLKKDSLFVTGINFLPKPYDLQMLFKAVRTCLDNGKLPQDELREIKPESAVPVT
jgi:CheY-like chemotaxis protein